MSYYIAKDRFGQLDLIHGIEWRRHKYIRKEGTRYIYPKDLVKKSGGLNKYASTQSVTKFDLGKSKDGKQKKRANSPKKVFSSNIKKAGVNAAESVKDLPQIAKTVAKNQRENPVTPRSFEDRLRVSTDPGYSAAVFDAYNRYISSERNSIGEKLALKLLENMNYFQYGDDFGSIMAAEKRLRNPTFMEKVQDTIDWADRKLSSWWRKHNKK